jgi:hypothetical protein
MYVVGLRTTRPPRDPLTANVILAKAAVSLVMPSPTAPKSSGVNVFSTGMSPPPDFLSAGGMLGAAISAGRESLQPDVIANEVATAKH